MERKSKQQEILYAHAITNAWIAQAYGMNKGKSFAKHLVTLGLKEPAEKLTEEEQEEMIERNLANSKKILGMIKKPGGR